MENDRKHDDLCVGAMGYKTTMTNKELGKHGCIHGMIYAWNDLDTPTTIEQAARATSAAPLYFPPIPSGKPPANYVDGGLKLQRCRRSLYDEAKNVQSKPHREIKCNVGVETGTLKATGDTGKQVLESVVAIAIRSGHVKNHGSNYRRDDPFAREREG